jgi:hypothetical protein
MNKLLALKSTASITALVLVCIPTARAQYNYFSSPQFGAYVGQYTPHKLVRPPQMDEIEARERKNNIAAKNKVDKTIATPSSPLQSRKNASANNNPLPYARDMALSTQIRNAFLEDFAKQMPLGEVAEMRATTEKTDLVQVLAGYIQLQGMDSSELGNLLAFWYGQAWAITHQKTLPTSQQYRSIATQMRSSLTSQPAWSNMSNAKRQTLFEQLAYPLIIQKANYQAYLKQGKADSILRMSIATREGMKKAGINLEQLQLGDNGFVGI